MKAGPSAKRKKQEKNQRRKQLIKISFVYFFALVTAVACGENFKPMTPEQIRAKKLENSGGSLSGSATFNPALRVTKTDVHEGYGTSYNLQFIIVEGSMTTTIDTYHTGVNSSYAKQSQLIDGRFQYQVNAICLDMSCNQVIALLERSDRNSAMVPQNLYYYAGNGTIGDMGSPAIYQPNSSFRSMEEAIGFVRERTRPN